MRRWWPVLLLFLIALFGVWFWSLGALPTEPERHAVVREIEGTVIVQPENGSESPAEVGTVLEEGATIITGPEDKATLDWFGVGETRLAPSSRLVIRREQVPGESPLALRLRLETGRAWTRVQRLLEIDADLSVETSDVVATVRGTSFDIEALPGERTTIWVADSVVEAAGVSVFGPPDGFFLPEGSMADFGAAFRATSTRPLSASDKSSDWFQNNREADERFKTEAITRMEHELAADRVPSVGIWRTLTNWSEALRERLSFGERREHLTKRYLLRRLIAIRHAAEEGKSGLAYQEFARMEGEMQDLLIPENGDGDTRHMVEMAQRLFEDVQPSSPAYRIKQQVEEWSMRMAGASGEQLYARLMMIDARLDEAVRAMDEDRMETASQVLVLARQGLANVDRERREAKEMTPEHAERLRAVWKALSVRADHLDRRLELDQMVPAPIEPTESVEEVIETAPTSTLPEVTEGATSTTPAPEPTPEPPPEPPKPVSMTITPVSRTIGFYERVTYVAIVAYDTGLTRDVTKLARFTMSPTGYGALFDNVFSATELQGTIVMTATYEEAGVPLQAQATLTIVDKKP